MEQLKVKNKDIVVINLLFFLVLSLVFLYLQYAYCNHLSPFSLVFFNKSFELFWYALIPTLISSLLIWRHHRYSTHFFVFCIGIVGFKIAEGLFIEFNKIIVIALFFYVVIFYFLLQLFIYYQSLASLNPNYQKSDLFSPLLKELKCSLWMGETSIEGELTNWDSEGCFLKLKETLPRKTKKARLRISFQGRIFEQDGEVVAHSVDFKGVGLKLGLTPKDLEVFNWSEFNDLLSEMGFKPERLR